jgi:glutamine---fructose-6-phosphate transaminase (isomerizing)
MMSSRGLPPSNSESGTKVGPGAIMWSEMAEQPDAIQRLVDRQADHFAALRALISFPVRGVVLIARGSSLNAATYLAYLIEVLANVPVSLARPSVTTRYGARPRYDGWLAVALSQSGQTPEIVSASQIAKECGARLVAMTNDPTSPLARIGDVHLALDVGKERAVPATKTVTAQMVCSLSIALSLVPPLDVGVHRTSIERVPELLRLVLADRDGVDRLTDRWKHYDALTVVARGYGFPAALECSLKVREVAGVFSEAWSVTAFRHGPIAGLNNGIPVLNISMQADDDEDTVVSVQQLQAKGIDVARCAPASFAELSLPVIDEYLLPIFAVVRGQQFAHALALARNRNPDYPDGLSKVTMTE